MGKYENEASVYQNNAKTLGSILEKTSSNIDSINNLLSEVSTDILMGDITTMTQSVKTKINNLKTKLNSNSTALGIEASRLDRLEEERLRRLKEKEKKELEEYIASGGID